jgi:hypothetical protein
MAVKTGKVFVFEVTSQKSGRKWGENVNLGAQK